MAYGAGIKLSNTHDFKIYATGDSNSNATVEIEPACYRGDVTVFSSNNISSGLAITDSHDIFFRSEAIGCNIGTQITQTASTDYTRQTYGISGQALSTGCSWGFLIDQRASAAQSMHQIDVRVQSRKCTTYGMYLTNSSSIPVENVVITYNGYYNCTSSAGNDVLLSGDVRAILNGMPGVGCYCGMAINGVQSSTFPPRVNFDFRGVANTAYVFGTGSLADLTGSITTTDLLLASTASNVKVARLIAGGTLSTYQDAVIRSKQYYPQDLPTTATYAKSLYLKDNGDGSSTVLFKNAS